jgi:hypothetical protein
LLGYFWILIVPVRVERHYAHTSPGFVSAPMEITMT